MSKLRALELAVGLFTGRSDMQPSAVLEQAKLYAEFLGEESQVIGGVVGKPRAVKAAKDTPAPVVVAETAVSQDDVDAAHAAAKVTADAALAVAKAKSQAAQVAAQQAAAQAAATAAQATTDGGVTLDEIKKVVGSLAVNSAAGGAPKVREILSQFGGASNISTLKAVHYAAAKAAIEEVLEAAALVA